jgi:hypothetical protein
MENNSTCFFSFPDDIILLVLHWLTTADLDNMKLVCKWFRTKCRDLVTCHILNPSVDVRSIEPFKGFHELCRKHGILRPLLLNRVFIHPTVSDKPDLPFSSLELSNATSMPTWFNTTCLDSLAVSVNATSIKDSTKFAHDNRIHPLATILTSCGQSKNLRAFMFHRLRISFELLTSCSKFDQLSLLSLRYCEITTPVLRLNILQFLRVLEIESKYVECYYDLPRGLETCIINFTGKNPRPPGWTCPQSVDAKGCRHLSYL